MGKTTFILFAADLGPRSQKCLNITMSDDQLAEPFERFMICGCLSQNAGMILINGCSDLIIRDNDGEIDHHTDLVYLFQ